MCDCLTDAQDCADSRYNALYDVERPHPCECECHLAPGDTQPLKGTMTTTQCRAEIALDNLTCLWKTIQAYINIQQENPKWEGPNRHDDWTIGAPPYGDVILIQWSRRARGDLYGVGALNIPRLDLWKSPEQLKAEVRQSIEDHRVQEALAKAEKAAEALRNTEAMERATLLLLQAKYGDT